MKETKMLTRIAKEFTWEMSHRLTFHKGLCKNIHGHSYKMVLSLTGELDENGLILDFYDMEKIVSPLLKKLDHAFMCSPDDSKTLDFLKEMNFKYFMSDEFTTCEQMSRYFVNYFANDFKKFKNIQKLGVRIFETIDAYAEVEIDLI